MRNYILAIDQGTTGTTALLIDENGETMHRSYSEFTQYYPKPGWVEHDGKEIWDVSSKVIAELINNHDIDARHIKAIGLTDQRETTVVWDRRTGEPVYNAIVWQCRRTAKKCSDLCERGLESLISEKTGLVIDPYFSATKLAWIFENVDGTREKAKGGNLCFGTIDSWLLWNLTGGAVHATEYTNASRTMLFNINSLEWDDDLMGLFEIPETMMPAVFPSSHVFGYTKGLEFLPDGIPIAGIAGDQQAALFGQLCFEPGLAKNTYGTGCFLMLNTGDQRVHSDNGLLTTLTCSISEKPVYALEGSVFIAGAVIQWLRDELGIIESAADTEKIARSVSDSAGVYFVPAFTGLGAPYWDADARGAILGLTRGATQSHLVRAALESIAFQTTDVVEAMNADSQVPIKNLRVDGGAVANDFLMQFQADLLNIEVERPVNIETTGLGAAFLAGLATGMWDSLQELQKCRQVDKIFSPKMSSEKRAKLRKGWENAVQKTLS